jgi:DNA polymerase III alpha subunit
MTNDQYGQIIYTEQDLVDLLLCGHEISKLDQIIVDTSVNINGVMELVESSPNFVYQTDSTESVEEFDKRLQSRWHMPQEYCQMDIAEYVLSLCSTSAQLQRVGQELLLYADLNLFNLLRYLKYLVDVMKANNIIWGVGRGSSVASYVLYLLEVHRVDSMYYNLDIREFLR